LIIHLDKLSMRVACSVPSKVRNCAVPPEHLRSEISFLRTKFDSVYSAINAWNFSLVVCLSTSVFPNPSPRTHFSPWTALGESASIMGKQVCCNALTQ